MQVPVNQQRSRANHPKRSKAPLALAGCNLRPVCARDDGDGHFVYLDRSQGFSKTYKEHELISEHQSWHIASQNFCLEVRLLPIGYFSTGKTG